ncbi:MAG: hypothetical protein LQ350_002315 [Teloschistes chrysophthalmus]|nr:MAG: hypothetical protein LQ350_002315 [Niorma chrysophthalma]
MGNVLSSLRWNRSEADEPEITLQSPASNSSSITTLCSSKPPQEADELSPLIDGVPKFMPSSNTTSFAYDYGRRLGAKEAKVAAEKKYADMSAKLLANQKRELDQQKRDLDKERKAVDVLRKDLDEEKDRYENDKAAHEVELAKQNAVTKRQIESARLATLKLQTTLEEEGHKTNEKLKAVTIRHTEEKKKIRMECEQKIAQLQADLNIRTAQRNKELRVNLLDWGPTIRHGAAELEELRGHVNALEEKLQSSEAELKMTRMNLAAQSQAARPSSNQPGLMAVGGQRIPEQPYDQGISQLLKEQGKELLLLRAKLAWLTSVIRGLHFSLSNHAPGRQLEDVKAAIIRAAIAVGPPMAPLCPFPSPPRHHRSQATAQAGSAAPLPYIQQFYPMTGYRASPNTSFRPPPPPPIIDGANQQMPSGHVRSDLVSNAWVRHDVPMSQWNSDGANHVYAGKGVQLQSQTIPSDCPSSGTNRQPTVARGENGLR